MLREEVQKLKNRIENSVPGHEKARQQLAEVLPGRPAHVRWRGHKLPAAERVDAEALAAKMGVRHVLRESDEIHNPAYKCIIWVHNVTSKKKKMSNKKMLNILITSSALRKFSWIIHLHKKNCIC